MMKVALKKINLKSYWLFLLVAFINSASGQQLEKTSLFKSNEILEARLDFSIKDIKKSKSDTIYHTTWFYYKNEFQQWDSISIDIRARGKFRRENCFFTPIKIEIKKKDLAGTLFEGNKKLKLVMPCLNSKGNNDLVIKEYLCYKMYEEISPYTFSTRLINLTFTDNRNRKSKMYHLKAFIIEDDKQVAKRSNGKILEGFQVNPLFMQDSLAAMQDVFQYMIGNTDWSSTMQHNVKVMLLPSRLKVPIPYDFDMTGLVNAPYAEVKETMPIKNVRERHFRGYCRDKEVFEYVRLKYLELEPSIYFALRRVENHLDPKETLEVENYLKDFFLLMKNKKRYDENISQACRKLE